MENTYEELENKIEELKQQISIKQQLYETTFLNKGGWYHTKKLHRETRALHEQLNEALLEFEKVFEENSPQ